MAKTPKQPRKSGPSFLQLFGGVSHARLGMTHREGAAALRRFQQKYPKVHQVLKDLQPPPEFRLP